MDYKIISDGCCDLEKEIIEQYNFCLLYTSPSPRD